MAGAKGGHERRRSRTSGVALGAGAIAALGAGLWGSGLLIETKKNVQNHGVIDILDVEQYAPVAFRTTLGPADGGAVDPLPGSQGGLTDLARVALAETRRGLLGDRLATGGKDASCLIDPSASLGGHAPEGLGLVLWEKGRPIARGVGTGPYLCESIREATMALVGEYRTDPSRRGIEATAGMRIAVAFYWNSRPIGSLDDASIARGEEALGLLDSRGRLARVVAPTEAVRHGWDILELKGRLCAGADECLQNFLGDGSTLFAAPSAEFIEGPDSGGAPVLLRGGASGPGEKLLTLRQLALDTNEVWRFVDGFWSAPPSSRGPFQSPRLPQAVLRADASREGPIFEERVLLALSMLGALAAAHDPMRPTFEHALDQACEVGLERRGRLATYRDENGVELPLSAILVLRSMVYAPDFERYRDRAQSLAETVLMHASQGSPDRPFETWIQDVQRGQPLQVDAEGLRLRVQSWAALVLTEYYQRTGRAEALSGAVALSQALRDNGAEALRVLGQGPGGYERIATVIHSLTRLFEISGDRRYRDTALLGAQILMASQRREASGSLWHGALAMAPGERSRGENTGWAVQALQRVRGLATLFRDSQLEDLTSAAIGYGLEHLSRLVVRAWDAPMVAEPSSMLGGVRLAPDDGRVAIDHSLSYLLAVHNQLTMQR